MAVRVAGVGKQVNSRTDFGPLRSWRVLNFQKKSEGTAWQNGITAQVRTRPHRG
jgi:hypothetical protein